MASGYLPKELRSWYEPLSRWFPWLFGTGGIEVGPIPVGTPVNLLANLSLISESGDTTDTVAQAKKVLALVLKIKRALKAAEGKSDEEAREVFAIYARRCSNSTNARTLSSTAATISAPAMRRTRTSRS